jgi:hypothetical protein
VLSGKTTDEASIRAAFTGLKPLGLLQLPLVELIMERYKIDEKEVIPTGKDSDTLLTDAGAMDKLAYLIGSRTTRTINAQQDQVYSTQDKLATMEKEQGISRGLVNQETRRLAGNTPLVMQNRFDMHNPAKQLEKYSQGSPEQATNAVRLANTIGPATEKALVDRSRPKVISDVLEMANKHSIEKRREQYKRLTGVDIFKNPEVQQKLRELQ